MRWLLLITLLPVGQTLEQLMLAETRMYHITVKVVSPTEDQGAARVRLKSNTIVFPQHVIGGGSTRVPGPFDGSAALDAALERVQCIFVGPKGRRSTVERTALMVPDLSLAPAVLLNALYFDLELDFTLAAQLALAQEAGCCVLTLTLTLTRLDLSALAALRPHAGPHVGSRIPDADSSVSKPNAPVNVCVIEL